MCILFVLFLRKLGSEDNTDSLSFVAPQSSGTYYVCHVDLGRSTKEFSGSGTEECTRSRHFVCIAETQMNYANTMNNYEGKVNSMLPN